MPEVREVPLSELPERVAKVPYRPRSVFAVGELPRGRCIAIVGTREATTEGVAFARNLARELASQGVAIISGGAKGIDRAAHEGALDAGGVTVVVGPSSYDHPYPEEHQDLFAKVVESGGAYLSLHQTNVVPRRFQFFARNYLLVALSQAVVVVESRHRGGARNAAKQARELGRPLLVVPGAPWQPKSAGCLEELRLGARMLVTAGDGMTVLDDADAGDRPMGQLSLFAGTLEVPSVPALPVSSQELRDRDSVLAALAQGPAHVDEICRRATLPPARVQEVLLTLTLEGALATLPPGRVSLVKL